MSNIHSIEEAYDHLAEVLNYLDEHGENVKLDENSAVGETANVVWEGPESGWVIET
jgi:hypothetical protein